MVARVNTVAFHGIDVQAVDVQVQISSGLLAFTIVGYKRPLTFFLIFFVIFFSITNAYADVVYKKGVMTCDENKNRVLIRFGAVYTDNDGDFPFITLPLKYKPLYGYLNEVPASEDCKLADGRDISFYHDTGQAFPYGQCGGDPEAFFTLKIEEKNIFYKHTWNGGRCSYTYDPFILILDNEKLISCRADNSGEMINEEKYEIKEGDCKEVSARLVSDLAHREHITFKRDQKISAYQNIEKDKEVCAYFQNKKQIGNTMWLPLINHKLGYIHMAKLDIDNDNLPELIYRFSAHNNYMDGNYFIYFNDPKERDWQKTDRENFLECLLQDKNCPENGDFKSANNFVKGVEGYWKDAEVISADLLSENVGKEYRLRYTMIKTKEINNSTYLYFKPTNNDVHPSAIVGKIKSDGGFETMCTYKSGSL